MSPELVDSFEKQWPEVSKRLAGMLAGKRVNTSKREDLVQETGLRLFGMWEKVDRNRPVWPLAVTIALNLIRDDARRKRDLEILGVMPDLPAGHDVEEEGLARLELERVQEAMSKLSPAHRSVLMVEVGDVPDTSSKGSNATKMLRHRARRALTMLLETAAVRAAVFNFKARRILLFGDRVLIGRNGSITADEAMAPAIAAIIAALALGSLPADSFGAGGAGNSERESIHRSVNAPSLALTSDAPAIPLSVTSESPRADLIAAQRERAGSGSSDANVRRNRRRGAGDPPSDGSYVVPLVGGKTAEVQGSLTLAGTGVRIGENHTGTPVCVVGGPAAANPYACEAGGADGDPEEKAEVDVSASVDDVGDVYVHARV